MDRRAWQAAVRRVTKSQTWLKRPSTTLKIYASHHGYYTSTILKKEKYLGWKPPSFSTLKTFPHYLLTSTGNDKKSSASLFLTPLKFKFIFSGSSKNFSLTFIFWSSMRMSADRSPFCIRPICPSVWLFNLNTHVYLYLWGIFLLIFKRIFTSSFYQNLLFFLN